MKNTILIVLAIIGMGILGLFIGFRLQRRFLVNNNRFMFNRQMMPNRFGGNRFGSRGGNWGMMTPPIQTGQISKIDNNIITIERPGGTTYTVNLTDQTQIEKTVAGTKADLKTGQNISVNGTATASGGFTVQSVLIKP